MAIITISRGSYSKGREVAERAAARLGYRLTNRDVLIEASSHFNIPEIRLVRAIHDAPSILDRFSQGRQSFLAYIRYALANQAQQDNLVYHGLAGHLLLRGVPHVLKVRIIADLNTRVETEVERVSISKAEARSLLLKDDEERRNWTRTLYGVDPWDPLLYDLIIHIDKLTVDDAVEFIVQAAGKECFRTTTEAQRKMDDLALACQVKAALVQEEFYNVRVTSEFGNVIVYTAMGGRQRRQLNERFNALRRSIPAINHLEMREDQPFPESAI
ncbi:MAG: cytidylate kinase-like family protein [Proteobacteria bacterium]|nr:cytidylate kinase-like family protein [Pseudomonadota bacterium]